MIIYSVTVSIENRIREDWLTWMQSFHIPEVMEKGYFSQYHMHELLEPVPEPGSSTFNIQYHCPTLEAYQEYQKKEAKALQEDHNQRYRGKFVAFRTLLKRH